MLDITADLDAPEERQIRDMKLGEEGYTLSWAWAVHTEQGLALNIAYPVCPNPGGTIEMRIKCIAGGWEVFVTQAELDDMMKAPLSWWISPPEDISTCVTVTVDER